MNVGDNSVFDGSLTVKGSTNLQSGLNSGSDVNVTGAVNATSPMTAPDFIKTSDYRVKRNLLPISDALHIIKALKPYLYEKYHGPNLDSFWESGLIAHEVQEIVNHPVRGQKDGKELQTISYEQLIPYLIRAIQQQQEQIEELQKRIAECARHHTRYG